MSESRGKLMNAEMIDLLEMVVQNIQEVRTIYTLSSCKAPT
jgi:hypothetical protein